MPTFHMQTATTKPTQIASWGDISPVIFSSPRESLPGVSYSKGWIGQCSDQAACRSQPGDEELLDCHFGGLRLVVRPRCRRPERSVASDIKTTESPKTLHAEKGLLPLS